MLEHTIEEYLDLEYNSKNEKPTLPSITFE
jgi:hypothetical protein